MAGMHKAVSERHGMTTIAALVAIVAMIFASVIAAPQRAYAEGYNISDLGWVDKDDTSFEISSDGGKTWKPYISGMQVNYGDQIRTELHWKVPNDVKINEGDTFVYDLPGNLEYKSNEKYPIYNGGDVVGYYTIDGDKMVATYTRGESAGSNIEAFVTTDGTITSNKTGGSAGGDTSFTFPGYGTITVNVEGKHRVNVVKRPAISTSDASTYDFVLEVTSTGTNTGVTIDDTMGGLLTFVDGSVHIYTDADCKNEYTGAWQSSKTDDHNFNVTIGSMGDGEKLYVRYSVNADKDSVIKACREAGNCSNATENKNKVTYSSNEDVNKKETSNSIWFNYSDWYVNKSATAAKDENGTQGFTWNITIGAGEGQSVDGATVKDLLDKNNLKEPTGDLVLSCYNSGDWKSVCPTGSPGAYTDDDPYNPQHYIKLSWSDLVAGTVTLPSGGYDHFQIQYWTEAKNVPVEGSGEHQKYKNEVTVKPQDGTGKTATAEPQLGTDAVELKKTCTSPASEAKNLTWVTSMKALEDLTNAELTDKLDVDDSGKDLGSKQTLVKDSIKVYTDAALTQQYAGGYTTEATDRGFTIVFASLPKGTTVYVQYQSTVNDGVTDETVWNRASALNKTSTAKHQHRGDVLGKEDANQYWDQYGYGYTANSKGVIRWRIKVHDVMSDAENIVVTDTLPVHTRYDAKSLKIFDASSTTKMLSGVSAKDNGDGTVTFTIAKGTPAFSQAKTSAGVLIVYETSIDPITAPDWGNYENKAHIDIDGSAGGDASATVGASKPKLLDKNGKYDATTAPNVNYTVKVNPNADTLNKGNNLTLTDTMGQALDLNANSVSIMDSDNGTAINGATWSYNPQTRELVFSIPDARACTITYTAAVQLKPGESFGSLGGNKIVLAGYENNGGTSQNTITGTVQQSKGGMKYDQSTLQIYKYADGDLGKPAGSATFKVESVTGCNFVSSTADADGTCNGTVGKEITKQLTTGASNGLSDRLQLDYDTVYKVTELTGPDGKVPGSTDSQYEKSAPLYVIFPGHDAQTAAGAYDGRYDNKTVTVDGQSGKLIVAVAKDSDGKTTTLGNYRWNCSNDHKTKFKVQFTKVDAANAGVPVDGATMQLTRVGSSQVESDWTWTTSGSETKTLELLPGRYKLTEANAPDGYQVMDPIIILVGEDGTITVDGKNVTGSDGIGHVQAEDAPKTTSLTVTKTWNDNNNQDGKRASVTFDLYRKTDGDADYTKVDGQSRILNPDKNDNVQWTGLPVKVDGKTAAYMAVETTTLGGYDSQCADVQYNTDGSAATEQCTNTHTPETTSIGVEKAWDDADNQDQKRPDSVTVHLLKNGEETDQSVTLDAVGNWRNDSAFTNLPVYEDGKKIVYTIREDTVSGYTTHITGSQTQGFAITNTHHPENEEVWFSKQDLKGTEIAGATMRLTGTLNDGTEFKTQTWVSERDKSKSIKLKPGTYTLTETKAPDGYLVADPVEFKVVSDAVTGKLSVQIKQTDGTYADVQDNTIVMTDQYRTHQVTVNKNSLTSGITNIDGAQMSITGTTLDGKAIDEITWTSKGGEPGELTLLPGTYTLREKVAPDGYETADDIVFSVGLDGSVTIDGKKQDSNTVVMKDKPGKSGILFSKTKVGGGAELAGAEFSITGKTFEGKTIDEITWTSGGGLPKQFQLQDGVYKLTETKAPVGYEKANAVNFTISRGEAYVDGKLVDGNTIRVEDRVDTTMVRVRKIWSDHNYSERPTSVTFHLLRNSKQLQDAKYTRTLDNKNTSDWTYTWTDLPRYDADGNRYNYTVDEELTQELTGKEYRVSVIKRPYIDGAEFTVLNIREPETASITVNKTWNDQDDNDGKRPKTLTFHIWGTSKQPKSGSTDETEDVTEQLVVQTVRTNGSNTQSWTFEGLPKQNLYNNPYTYTVTEESVDGYTASDVTLAGGTETRCAVTSTVKSCAFDVTNTHTPETTTLSVDKTWDDTDAPSNVKRPGDKATIWVLSSVWTDAKNQTLPGWPSPQHNSECKDTGATDGTNPWGVSCMVLTSENAKATQATTANVNGADGTSEATTSQEVSADTWTYTFTNLPKYYKGKEIQYSVTEEAVKNYTPTLTGGKVAAADGAEGKANESGESDKADETSESGQNAESWAYTLTNTYTPGHTSHSVHKVWKDYGDSSKRPKAVYATLYANGQSTGKTVALSDGNNWQYTFTDLDENKVYTVKETNEKGEAISGVDGYCQPVISDDRKTGISTITNTISIVLPSTGGQRWCYGTLLAVVALGMIGMGYGIAKRNKTNKEGDAR